MNVESLKIVSLKTLPMSTQHRKLHVHPNTLVCYHSLTDPVF